MENIIDNKCTKCSLWQTSQVGQGLYSCNCLKGEGSGSILFIGDFPKDEEIKQKHPFVGAEGQLLKKCANSIGIKEAYYTYLCRCKPGFGKVLGQTEINACVPYLVLKLVQ